VQVFDGNGKYEAQWVNMHRPSGLYVMPGKCPICFLGEIGPYLHFNRNAPNLGPRISVVDHTGKLLARLCVTPSAGTKPGQFTSPHGLCVDSRGDLYVAEVAFTAWPSLFPDTPAPADLRSLQKLEKVPAEQAATPARTKESVK
jgi:NHL repeat